MINGVDVTVLRSVASGEDRFGNPTHGTTTETVSDVLVAPGATSDMEASRPEGVTVAYTLHFPRGYESSLEGCSVVLPDPWDNGGKGYRVIGDPRPYMDVNCPGQWHMAVEVEDAHG